MTEETETKKTKTYYELQIGEFMTKYSCVITDIKANELPEDKQEGHIQYYYFTKFKDAERFADKYEKLLYRFEKEKQKVVVGSLITLIATLLVFGIVNMI